MNLIQFFLSDPEKAISQQRLYAPESLSLNTAYEEARDYLIVELAKDAIIDLDQATYAEKLRVILKDFSRKTRLSAVQVNKVWQMLREDYPKMLAMSR